MANQKQTSGTFTKFYKQRLEQYSRRIAIHLANGNRHLANNVIDEYNNGSEQVPKLMDVPLSMICDRTRETTLLADRAGINTIGELLSTPLDKLFIIPDIKYKTIIMVMQEVLNYTVHRCLELEAK